MSLQSLQSFQSFQSNVESFCKSVRISPDIEKEFNRELIKFILQIQDKTGSTTLRSFAFKNGFDEDFSFFKNQYLDYSFYIHRILWKAVIRNIQTGEISSDENVMSDINFCIRQLNKMDINKAKTVLINEDLNVDSIDLSKMQTGRNKKRDIITYAKSKAGSLRYLVEYDQGMELEDFEQDLACEQVRIFNYYNRSHSNKLKEEKASNILLNERIQKYMETALNNKVLNIKEYWGCESRRRVSTTDAKDYRTRARLKKLLSKYPDNTKYKDQLTEVENRIKHSDSDFYSTVTSFVRGQEGEERELDAQELSKEAIVPMQYTMDVDDKLWVEGLILDLPSNLSKFVTIILLDNDSKFEAWFDKWSCGKYTTDNYSQFVKGAMVYCNVTRDELRKNPMLLNSIQRKNKDSWDHLVNKKNKGKLRDKVFVQNLMTKKIHFGQVVDDRPDGSVVFKINDPKYRNKEIDTLHDSWKVVKAY